MTNRDREMTEIERKRREQNGKIGREKEGENRERNIEKKRLRQREREIKLEIWVSFC